MSSATQEQGTPPQPRPLSLDEAIARQEGFGIPDALATRNNNPGNIRWSPFSLRYRGVEGADGFTRFPSVDVGWAALRGLLLSVNYRDLTVGECIARWAPPTENDTGEYIRNICEWCACTPETPIAQLLP